MSTDTLGADLKRLKDLDRDELLSRWQSLYEREPPANMSKSLLIRAIAYRLQENVLGGLKSATQRFLAQYATGDAPAMSTVNTKVGTCLLREWHGVVYEVTILEDGVMFKGKKYDSLSKVAGIITGTVWSGPVFFGLKKKKYG